MGATGRNWKGNVPVVCATHKPAATVRAKSSGRHCRMPLIRRNVKGRPFGGLALSPSSRLILGSHPKRRRSLHQNGTQFWKRIATSQQYFSLITRRRRQGSQKELRNRSLQKNNRNIFNDLARHELTDCFERVAIVWQTDCLSFCATWCWFPHRRARSVPDQRTGF